MNKYIVYIYLYFWRIVQALWEKEVNSCFRKTETSKYVRGIRVILPQHVYFWNHSIKCDKLSSTLFCYGKVTYRYSFRTYCIDVEDCFFLPLFQFVLLVWKYLIIHCIWLNKVWLWMHFCYFCLLHTIGRVLETTCILGMINNIKGFSNVSNIKYT